jgi:hypothetical protein
MVCCVLYNRAQSSTTQLPSARAAVSMVEQSTVVVASQHLTALSHSIGKHQLQHEATESLQSSSVNVKPHLPPSVAFVTLQ